MHEKTTSIDKNREDFTMESQTEEASNTKEVGKGFDTNTQRQPPNDDLNAVMKKQQTPKKKKRKKRRFDKQNDHILIVGSGLAGLSCALSLEQAGYTNISLYERDSNFDTQKEGYGLTISYNPKGPLAKLNLLEDVAIQDCPSRSHYIFRVSLWGFVLCIFVMIFVSSVVAGFLTICSFASL